MKDNWDADIDLCHDLVVDEHGIRARYVRLSVRKLPYDAPPCVSGLRVFGKGDGEKPKAPKATVKRISDLDYIVSVEQADDALGHNILWGHCPDKLYHSYMVMENEIIDKRIGALVKGQACYVRVDAFNENGIATGPVYGI